MPRLEQYDNIGLGELQEFLYVQHQRLLRETGQGLETVHIGAQPYAYGPDKEFRDRLRDHPELLNVVSGGIALAVEPILHGIPSYRLRVQSGIRHGFGPEGRLNYEAEDIGQEHRFLHCAAVAGELLFHAWLNDVMPLIQKVYDEPGHEPIVYDYLDSYFANIEGGPPTAGMRIFTWNGEPYYAWPVVYSRNDVDAHDDMQTMLYLLRDPNDPSQLAPDSDSRGFARISLMWLDILTAPNMTFDSHAALRLKPDQYPKQRALILPR